MKLPVLLICGPFCQHPAKLFAAIYQAITLSQEPIVVDFTGTTGLSADFFAFSFGKLPDHISKENYDARVTVIMDEVSLSLYGVIMDHAFQYQENPVYRQIMDIIQQTPPPPKNESQMQEPPAKPAGKGTKSPHVQVATKAVEV